MDLNVKLLGLVAAVALLVGGVYWLNSQTAAQGELAPQPAEASNPGHSNPGQGPMARGGMGGSMGQMGQMSQMDMAAMMERMQQMHAPMAQMLEACRQMMANMGMGMDMSEMGSMTMPGGAMSSSPTAPGPASGALTEGTTFLELELQGIGVPSRVFRWEGDLLRARTP